MEAKTIQSAGADHGPGEKGHHGKGHSDLDSASGHRWTNPAVKAKRVRRRSTLLELFDNGKSRLRHAATRNPRPRPSSFATSSNFFYSKTPMTLKMTLLPAMTVFPI
jgi:hypothetical protein